MELSAAEIQAAKDLLQRWVSYGMAETRAAVTPRGLLVLLLDKDREDVVFTQPQPQLDCPRVLAVAGQPSLLTADALIVHTSPTKWAVELCYDYVYGNGPAAFWDDARDTAWFEYDRLADLMTLKISAEFRLMHKIFGDAAILRSLLPECMRAKNPVITIYSKF